MAGIIQKIILTGITFLLLFSVSLGRALYDYNQFPITVNKTTTDAPYVDFKVHNVGKLGVTISNQGSFGTGFIGDQADPTTGLPAPSGVYPYPGNIKYIFAGAFWIGAVVGRDTLVSVGADGWQYTREMWPDGYPDGAIESHSISDPNDELAVSEQDFIAVYTDTVTDPSYVQSDPTDGRPHLPLNIEITQRSYAWSYEYAEDFILFDYSIKNIGRTELNKVYMAVYLDAECRRLNGVIPDEFQDDICGFRESIVSPYGCGFRDTINTAWIADNDGSHNEDEGCPNNFEMTSVAGIRVVRTPSDSLNYSFNWWISNGNASLDFGPRLAGRPDDPFRDFGGFLGTPEGDRNKYYVMRHKEFDYDQLFSAKDHSAEGWLPPSGDMVNFADGYDTRFLLSFGPFDISPGEVLPVSFAYVHGENLHHDCDAWARLFRPQPASPEAYYDQLDFSDFGLNTMWASWIYDNPGVDTDGDDLFGKYRICGGDTAYILDTVQIDPILVVDTSIEISDFDTLWYEGDGVPDFRGASPPPPPELRVVPSYDSIGSFGTLTVQWNGYLTETARDRFSNLIDFEGYRVYYSLTPQVADYVLLGSYDIEDYTKYIWINDRSIWQVLDPPFSGEAVKNIYGIDFNLHPELLGSDQLFYIGDSLFYFMPQDWNLSEADNPNQIHKRFPDQAYPTTLNLDSALLCCPDELTDEGQLKYFEYEYLFNNILPSRLYYLSVTAFDFGSPKSGLPSLESSPKMNAVAEYPQFQNSIVEENNLDVIVYPNPYIADGSYREIGFEGLGDENQIDDRARSIHFINLPPRCTIRIYTLDGDLVREIDHDCLADSPQCMHDEWDVITRNTQAPVSGIYYWTVVSPTRTQIGKLVLIM